MGAIRQGSKSTVARDTPDYSGTVRTQLPTPLMYPLLYGVVVVAVVYKATTGGTPVMLASFVGAMAVLVGVDLLEWLRYPSGASIRLAIALLIVRVVVYGFVAAVDPSGIARVLLLLLPFRVRFLFGRVAAVSVGLGLIVGIVLLNQVGSSMWWLDGDKVDDVVMFAVGLTLALCMAEVAVGERAARRQLMSATEAAERTRLGREIHDGVGHYLTAVSVLLEKSIAFRELDAEVADAAIRDAQGAARQALDAVRRSIHAMDEREPFDVMDAVSSLGRALPVTVVTAGNQDGYDDARRLAFFRSAQESVTNALRHASATRIDVQLDLGDKAGTLTVRDDGMGFESVGGGSGLSGLEGRVARLGGELQVRSALGVGTWVEVSIPRTTR
ncbi:sensor histidine kinase [Microbacterium sp. NPDC016588]